MTIDEFDQFCESLPHTTLVIQWGNAHVWKIGGKVFAVGGWSHADEPGITFKCTASTFRNLKNKPGFRPAPYLASRGMTWLQWLGPETVSLDGLLEHLWQSYRLVAMGLTKAKRLQLGLDGDIL